MTADADGKSFWARTRTAKRVMVLDIGNIGDTVHLLPALWMIRQAYPKAELHVAVGDHVTSLMKCVPWVDESWGYPRMPKRATLGQNLNFLRRLRGRKFDAVINLNGSDRSSWLTFFSGARERLGRVPSDGGPAFWRRLFTQVVEHPYLPEPVHVQKCRCLEKAGLPFFPPEFHVEIDPAGLAVAEIAAADAGTYFHLSAFTTDDRKELSPGQLVEFIHLLHDQYPQMRWVVSCAPNDRERGKLGPLLAALRFKPWRVFDGKLNLVQLTAVIQQSALHLSGDTGTLHLAVMAGTPTVSWFQRSSGMQAWIPPGAQNRVVVGDVQTGMSFLTGVPVPELVESTRAALAARSARPPAPA